MSNNPHQNAPREPAACSPDALGAIIRGRRSVRAYEQRAVPREYIAQMLDAACWAPSPHGRQPWRFVVLTQPAGRERLAAAMGARWREQLARDGQETQTIDARQERSYQRIITAPAIVMPCLYLEDLDQYPDAERQAAEHTMAVQSLGCTVQNMLLMAYSLGLDCGWMCAPLFCPDDVRTALGLDETLIPHALITVGYAVREPVRRPHRMAEELIVLYD
jgi:F420 biosynthesis protein FbiB-like protein